MRRSALRSIGSMPRLFWAMEDVVCDFLTAPRLPAVRIASTTAPTLLPPAPAGLLPRVAVAAGGLIPSAFFR